MGHGGTSNEVNGGKIGVAAWYLFPWMLRGNVTASQWFKILTMATADGWSVVSKDFDKMACLDVEATPTSQRLAGLLREVLSGDALVEFVYVNLNP